MTRFDRALRVLCVLTGAATASARAEAQTPVTQLTVSAGSGTDERGIRSDAVSIAPSIAFLAGPRTSLTLGASGTRFQAEGWQLGGGAGLSSRSLSAGGFALTLSAMAGASRSSFNTTFTNGEVTPGLEWSRGPLSLQGGYHLASAHTATDNPPPPVPVPGQTPIVSLTRTSRAPVLGAALTFAGDAPSTGVLVAVHHEPAEIEGVRVTEQSADATVAFGALTLTGHGGRRISKDENLDYASGSAAVALSRTVSLELSGGQYPSNRLTGSAAGRFLNAGVSLRFGGSAGGPSLPSPSGVGAPAKGVTRLAIRAPSASRVELAGDWSRWTPQPATKANNGVWYVDVSLDPGEYRYAFRVDGKEWRVPEGAVAADDGFGGKSAYVRVSRTDGN